MPININDQDYVKAEKDYYEATTLEEKLQATRKMISHAPGHKGAENLRQQLTTRRKKLESQIVKAKKTGKGTFTGVKKEDMQGLLVGNTNSGKSSLLQLLTNAKLKISENKFTTTKPMVGIMEYLSVPIQLVENPSIDSENFDKGLPNTTDTILILITKLEEIEEIKKQIPKSKAKQIIIFNKIDELSTAEKRKLKATLQSKKYNFVLISTVTLEGIEKLKKKIFESFDNLRIYTKEPGKPKSKKPMILKPNSNIKDVAEKILKGLSRRIKKTKIWGPSSKFSGQIVGLNHKVKDLDTVEFTTN
ncbi:TGS domain-containing protein [archaeon]|jgi:ribosome-interacting GTPase 1|nr:TGS domain-containing protein [archaeon]